MRIRSLILAGVIVASAQLTHASEPSYCNPKNFENFARENNVSGLQRARIYQIGKLTLHGLAVGKSNVQSTVTVANQYSKYSAIEKSCTWYFNTGNPSAGEAFHHIPLPRPYMTNDTVGVADKFETLLQDAWTNGPVNFVSCAIEHNYLAMGCDGMKHRGPSVFAMFLAFSGCSPENSATIANTIWGLNTVSKKMRIEIAKRGYQLGAQDPDSRKALQDLMLSP